MSYIKCDDCGVEYNQSTNMVCPVCTAEKWQPFDDHPNGAIVLKDGELAVYLPDKFEEPVKLKELIK